SEVKRFVDKEVIPAATELDHKDQYPQQLVDQLREMGIFGMTISPEYGGLGLPFLAYSQVVEELSRGWMSLGGIINTHVIVAYVVEHYGTEEQKKRWLPLMAEGAKRCALCVTEPNAGSDVQAIETVAVRDGDFHVLNGTKMFVSNGRYAHFYLVLCKTNKNAQPPAAGMSAILVEKGTEGFRINRDIEKLGYKGLDTVEIDFQDALIPAFNLVGGKENEGFKQVMSGLEVGRINVASRAVGLARAAFEDAIAYSFQRRAFGQPIFEHQAIHMSLAEMATKIDAARLLTYRAAEKKQRGERSDLESGMAKLFASEVCQEVVVDAMRVFGGYGYTKEMRAERYYRDAPMLIVGEGTSQVQKIVIARALERKYKRK
ncbi:MAG: acyl-CoA dehydrogenase family protein, partial [Chloroflexi bacterium]|nr:acyl-CoA dehydrogenase family protein [Chloroflexota bacterium]